MSRVRKIIVPDCVLNNEKYINKLETETLKKFDRTINDKVNQILDDNISKEDMYKLGCKKLDSMVNDVRTEIGNINDAILILASDPKKRQEIQHLDDITGKLEKKLEVMNDTRAQLKKDAAVYKANIEDNSYAIDRNLEDIRINEEIIKKYSDKLTKLCEDERNTCSAEAKAACGISFFTKKIAEIRAEIDVLSVQNKKHQMNIDENIKKMNELIH